MRHFLDLAEWSSNDLWHIIQLSVYLKTEYETGGNRPLMAGKTLGMIMEKQSLRTRVSFEVAMQHLGGKTITLGPDEIGRLGQRESVPDTARVLSGYVQFIAARVYSHQNIRLLAQYANVPVINALCDLHHPCQAMADMLTVYEHFGRLKGLRVAYVGDGNNVAYSLMLACAHFGVHFTIATPAGYALQEEQLDSAAHIAQHNGSTLRAFEDPAAATRDVDVIYTDTWVSMGQESQAQQRAEHFRAYQVNDDLLARADREAMVMHCLPAHRGDEISSNVADGPRSLIFKQAENRLHVQKGILVKLLNTK
jgi:ornithine carbamoyltransferase